MPVAAQSRAVAVQRQVGGAARSENRTGNHRAIPLRVPDPAKLRSLKTRAEQRSGFGPQPGAAGPLTAPRPSVTVFGGLNQPGLGQPQCCTPPDTTGAIGPSHYLEFVNNTAAVFNRSTLASPPLAQMELAAFTGHPGGSWCDPQIKWDQQAGRWLYAAIDCADTGQSMGFGWSKTADPSDLANGWCKFTLDTGKDFEDYPKLGSDDNHIIIGTNTFTGGFFSTSKIFSIDKPVNGVTTCPGSAPTATSFGSGKSPLTTADGDTAFTPEPALSADSSDKGYIAAADSPFFVSNPSQIMVWHLSGARGTTPTLTEDGNVNVASFAIPAGALQPGTANQLDTLDARLTQAVAHADPGVSGGGETIWTQHTVAGAGLASVVRWYQLKPGTSTPLQQGTISDPTSFVFNGAISPTSSGDAAAIFYNVSGTAQLPAIRAQGRAAGALSGQMQGEITLKTSNAADNDFSCSPCRWGDYAGASPDPNNPGVVWGSNQWIGASGNPSWATQNFAVSTATANVAPQAAFTITPNPANNGQQVAFDGSGSTDPDGGAIADYRWDLDGNGSFETDTGTTPTTTATYAGPASLNVGLQVTDNDGGATGIVAHALTVNGILAGSGGSDSNGDIQIVVRPETGVKLLRKGSVNSKGSVVVGTAANPPTVSTTETLVSSATAAGRNARKPVKLGSGSATIPLRRTRQLTLRLNRAAMRTLKKKRKLRGSLTVRARGSGGQIGIAKRTITLRPAKKK